MNDIMTAVPSVLPDIAAAAALILLGVAFIRGRMQCRTDEQKLQEAIRSLQEAIETEDIPERNQETE